MIVISIIIFLILIVVGLLFLVKKRYEKYLVKINIIEEEIEKDLNQKFDLLNKLVNLLKNDNKEVIEEVVKLRSRKTDSFILDRKLIESVDNFDDIKKKYPELKNNSKYTDVEFEIEECSEILNASKQYYNTSIIKYNKLTRTFPFNIVANVYKYDEKKFYE